MTGNEYQELTRRTGMPPDINYSNFTHKKLVDLIGKMDGHLRKTVYANGLAGETAEVVELIQWIVNEETAPMMGDINTLKELGDINWYMARIADEYGIEMNKVDQVVPFQVTLKSELANLALTLVVSTGNVVEMIKKNIGHGHEIDLDHLTISLRKVNLYTRAVALSVGINVEQIREYNIERLMKRYPEGFSSEKSINRVE